MALISIDPFAFIAQLKHETNLFKWVSLIFQMGLSSVVSFCGVTGLDLRMGTSVSIAVGDGLLAIAVVLSAFFASSSLTRGMWLVRPMKVAEQEIKTGMAITHKSE